MLDEKVTRRNISLYPSQWAVIDAKAKAIGMPGVTSAGLKALIAEYERLVADIPCGYVPTPQAEQYVAENGKQ